MLYAAYLFYSPVLLHNSTKCVLLREHLLFLFWFEFEFFCIIKLCLKKVRISVLILFLCGFFFSVLCLLSCESDWSVAVILPKQGTNGIGLLDKSMQTDCILSVDRIMEGLHEVPHSFCYWLWRGFCTGVLFPLDKEVLWLVTFLMKALQREMQNVCSAVFSIWQLFLLSFFCPIEVQPILEKHTFWFFSLILGLVDFHEFDPVKKLYTTDSFPRLPL